MSCVFRDIHTRQGGNGIVFCRYFRCIFHTSYQGSFRAGTGTPCPLLKVLRNDHCFIFLWRLVIRVNLLKKNSLRSVDFRATFRKRMETFRAKTVRQRRAAAGGSGRSRSEGMPPECHHGAGEVRRRRCDARLKFGRRTDELTARRVHGCRIGQHIANWATFRRWRLQWRIQKFRKGEGAEGIVSAPSSIIANAHNELYAIYTGKGDFLKKI